MHRLRVCECGCRRKFKPKHKLQKYVDQTHKNRAAQSRWRAKAQAAINGTQEKEEDK